MDARKANQVNFFLLFLLPVVLSIGGCGNKKYEVKSEGQNEPTAQRDKIRLKHYLIEGQRLYLENCSNCHQKDGTGLGRLIPPLKDSDFLKDDVDRTICLVKNGISGEIIVNGKDYNHNMPGNKEMTELEIAEVVTYVYNVWGGKSEIIAIDRVRKTLKNCSTND